MTPDECSDHEIICGLLANLGLPHNSRTCGVVEAALSLARIRDRARWDEAAELLEIAWSGWLTGTPACQEAIQQLRRMAETQGAIKCPRRGSLGGCEEGR